MPKIIVTSRYIAPSVPKSHLEYYTKYIATRPGVVINNTNSVGIEPQKPSNPNDPVSEKQKQMIDQLLQDFKDAKKLFEYEDYINNPTQGTASDLISAVIDRNADIVIGKSAYTHLQRAQPITFGHALMAYAWMLLRDLQRFEDATARMDAQCPLGSGALAGTTYPLDRQFTAEKLGFAAPCPNSLDGVSDRDFCIELANAISICMMHLSRLSEEIILWCSWEFKFIELDDAFTTGSSIMPQKKNPDVTELIRGKTGRVYGDLNTLLVMMKGIPLAYNKDMQEDKEAIFDAVDTLELCLKTVTSSPPCWTVSA